MVFSEVGLLGLISIFEVKKHAFFLKSGKVAELRPLKIKKCDCITLNMCVHARHVLHCPGMESTRNLAFF